MRSGASKRNTLSVIGTLAPEQNACRKYCTTASGVVKALSRGTRGTLADGVAVVAAVNIAVAALDGVVRWPAVSLVSLTSLSLAVALSSSPFPLLPTSIPSALVADAVTAIVLVPPAAGGEEAIDEDTCGGGAGALSHAPGPNRRSWPDLWSMAGAQPRSPSTRSTSAKVMRGASSTTSHPGASGGVAGSTLVWLA